MLETSPLLGGGHRWNNNRLNRLSFNNNSKNNNGGGGRKQRRQSSLKFLFFLTILSAIVTYFYDDYLAPYNTVDDSQPIIDQDRLRTASVGSVVDETQGYILSDDQRKLARTLNVEKRVSCCFINYIAFVCRDVITVLRDLSHSTPLYHYDSSTINYTDSTTSKGYMARMHPTAYAS